MYQDLNKQPEGKKLTRFKHLGEYYFKLGWDEPREGDTLYQGIGFKNEREVTFKKYYQKGLFTEIDKLILA